MTSRAGLKSVSNVAQNGLKPVSPSQIFKLRKASCKFVLPSGSQTGFNLAGRPRGDGRRDLCCHSRPPPYMGRNRFSANRKQNFLPVWDRPGGNSLPIHFRHAQRNSIARGYPLVHSPTSQPPDWPHRQPASRPADQLTSQPTSRQPASLPMHKCMYRFATAVQRGATLGGAHQPLASTQSIMHPAWKRNA